MATPALAHLMGTYLHQDFDSIGTVDDNVDRFVDDEPELASSLPAEIAALLADEPSEGAIESLLDSMGCELQPGPDDGGYRDWLSAMASRAEARLASIPDN